MDKNTKNPNFIGCWTIEPDSICEDLINYFELNIKRQKQGSVGSGINQDIKDSTDMTIHPKEINLPENKIFKTYFYNHYFQYYFLKNINFTTIIICNINYVYFK